MKRDVVIDGKEIMVALDKLNDFYVITVDGEPWAMSQNEKRAEIIFNLLAEHGQKYLV